MSLLDSEGIEVAVRRPRGGAALGRIARGLASTTDRWSRPATGACAVTLALAVTGATVRLRPIGTASAAFPAAASPGGSGMGGQPDPIEGRLAVARSSNGGATVVNSAAPALPGLVPVAAYSPAAAQAGEAGAEAAALATVEEGGGIPLRAGDLAPTLTQPLLSRPGTCPFDRLRVLWSAPQGSYDVGGYLAPLGPAPTAAATAVNGVVVCDGSTFEYIGFEAFWDGQHWSAAGVPSAADDHGPRLPSDDTVAPPTPAQPAVTPTAGAGPASVVTGSWGPAIEDLAPYVPQSLCDPTPKPGAVGLRTLLLHSFPGSRDLGIGQACDTPDGVSEHKEGRAFDWGVRADVPAEDAMADRFLAWLFAPDQYGNQYAMIRRLGIMYMIWDDHIWGSYAADQGWRPYGGPNPHTDHIHISFSWAGALAQTSFWTGHVADVALVAPPPGAIPPPAPAPIAALAAGSAPVPPPAASAAPAPGPAPAPGSSGAPSGTGSAPPGSAAGPGGGTAGSSTTTSTTTTTTTAPPAAPPPAPPPSGGPVPPPPVTVTIPIP